MPDPSSCLDNAPQQLSSDGFLQLHELCSAEFLQQLLDVAHEKIRAVQQALGRREIGIGSAAGFDEIVQRSPGRWDVPIGLAEFALDGAALPWSGLVSTVLGAGAEHSFSGVVFSDPGSPAQCWHCDSPHLSEQHRPAHALNVMVALHHTPIDMGPTEVARGSHRLTNHLRNRSLVRDELIYQHASTSPQRLVEGSGRALPEAVSGELAAGDCLVFDDRLLHRGLANHSERTRYMAYFSYRQQDYCENTHFESTRSVFAAEG